MDLFSLLSFPCVNKSVDALMHRVAIWTVFLINVCVNSFKPSHLGTRNFTKTQSCDIAELASLVLLNLSRCGICDEGCENLEGKHDANY